MSSYAVVVFETNALSRVPMKWLSDTEGNEAMCLWPNKRAEWFIATCAAPEKDWRRHKVKILAQRLTFEDALDLEIRRTKATTSESEAEKQVGRCRRPPSRFGFELEFEEPSFEEPRGDQEVTLPSAGISEDNSYLHESQPDLENTRRSGPQGNWAILEHGAISCEPNTNVRSSSTLSQSSQENSRTKEPNTTSLDLTKIINLLVEVKMTVENIDCRLQRIEASYVKESTSISVEKITDASSLHSFLERVQGREEEYVKYLSVIGGMNLRQTVARVVDTIIDHKGQLYANLDGRIRKADFTGKVFGIRGPLLTLMCDAVLKSPIGARSTRAEVEEAIGRYLRGAADRRGGRKKRFPSDGPGAKAAPNN